MCVGERAFLLIILSSFVIPSTSVIDSYPGLSCRTDISRDDLIKRYFALGFDYSEILSCLLFSHGISLSLRQLKRILARLQLRRRKNYTDLNDVLGAIQDELNGSGRLLGYRAVWQKLKTERNMAVNKETVRHAMRLLDPEGVEARRRHRLKRREYKGRGPNFLWHIDGYDKLKPFGFGIHGCVDGYSRRIMWLEVTTTNNDPSVVARYFVDCIRQVGGTARVVRADNGTENTYIAAIQRFLRHSLNDSLAGEKSFRYGKSVSNQRIEAWWSQLRRGLTDWWIVYFKELRESGLYCDVNPIHVECLKFCYMDLIRDSLHQKAQLWNSHRIRPNSNQDSPAGRPDILYFLPDQLDTRDFKTEVPEDSIDLQVCETLLCTTHAHELNCSPEFSQLANIIMNENGLQMPKCHEDAKLLYLMLTDEIEKL